jgi:hypothetical protein
MIFGLRLFIIGLIFAILGIGGSAKASIKGLGIFISASAGIVLMVVGAWMMYLGI